MHRLRRLLKTTAIRLTLVYTLLFSIVAVGVVTYISYNTSRLLISQFQTALGEEVQTIARIAQLGGMRRLIPIIEQRSRRPGANLYLIADQSGRIIAGNVRDVDRKLLVEDGWRLQPFQYRRFAEEEQSQRAIAQVFSLPGNLKLLVGRDVGDAEKFRQIVQRASAIALLVMVLIGIVVWFAIGQRALRHIDRVSKASRRIIAGDLSGRVPLSGSGDEFDRLGAILNDLIARIETLNTGVRNMSDSIAHDLKTPLTRLRNDAEQALHLPDGGSREEALSSIILEADGMIRTFDALLMISQVEAGARTASLEDIELASIVEDVHELFEPSAEELDVEITVSTDGPLYARGNRELVAQALTNLIDNALKYGLPEHGGRIELSAEQIGNKARLEVRDNGPGIAAEDRIRVLQRFIRLDDSRTKSGSGLGLALVEAVVRLHDGTLGLGDGKPGLVVTIDIPLSGKGGKA